MDELNGDNAPMFTRKEQNIENLANSEVNRVAENGAARFTHKEHHIESGENIPHHMVPQIQAENKRHRKLSRLVSKDWFETRSIGVFTSGGDSQGNQYFFLLHSSPKEVHIDFAQFSR